MSAVEPNSTISAVLQLAQTCEFDSAHTQQVARLALRLFDELQPFHQLTPKERACLHYAARWFDHPRLAA